MYCNAYEIKFVCNGVSRDQHLYYPQFLSATSIFKYSESSKGRRTYITERSMFLFSPIALKLFSPRFRHLELRKCNKKFLRLSSVVCRLPSGFCPLKMSVHSKFVIGLAVTLLVLFVWKLVHLCIYGIPRAAPEGFLIFFPFLLDFLYFWDLDNFWGEVQTTSKSKVYGFYELNGPF